MSVGLYVVQWKRRIAERERSLQNYTLIHLLYYFEVELGTWLMLCYVMLFNLAMHRSDVRMSCP
jgi:hypothetical protein